MRKLALTLSLALGLVMAVGLPASAQSGTGEVIVVHAVPDTPVDVYVDGSVALEDFQPKTITDPIELPAGEHQIEIRPAGADASSDPVISGSANLPAGAQASIAAHLDADGNPTLTVFVDDVSTTDVGDARLTVRHTAAAPAVDVLADGSALIEGLTNPDEATAAVPAGSYSVEVRPAGGDQAVIGPVDLALEEGTAYRVYAYGSLEAGNLDLLVDTTSGLHSAPSGVPSGTGGQASALPIAAVVLMALSVLAIAGGVRRLVTVRS